MGNCPDSECYVVSKNAGRYTVVVILSFCILMFYVDDVIPVYNCKYMNYIVLLQKKLFLEYAAGTDVAAFVVGLGRAADDDAVAGRGVDETEAA